jgi:pyruvate/oxaloacetate carboxyltransferase
MEYIVIGLLVIVVCLLWYKQPSKMTNIVATSVLTTIKSNRDLIVLGAYDKLPADVKDKLPEEVVKSIVEQVIDRAVEAIEEGVK